MALFHLGCPQKKAHRRPDEKVQSSEANSGCMLSGARRVHPVIVGWSTDLRVSPVGAGGSGRSRSGIRLRGENTPVSWSAVGGGWGALISSGGSALGGSGSAAVTGRGWMFSAKRRLCYTVGGRTRRTERCAAYRCAVLAARSRAVTTNNTSARPALFGFTNLPQPRASPQTPPGSSF